MRGHGDALGAIRIFESNAPLDLPYIEVITFDDAGAKRLGYLEGGVGVAGGHCLGG